MVRDNRTNRTTLFISIEPTPEEQLRQPVKGGKGEKPKGQSQKRVEEYNEAPAQDEEELYNMQLAERERKKDLEKQKEREVEGETSRGRIGEVVLKVDITDSDGEEDTKRDNGIQPGDLVVQREVEASDAREKPASESGQSSQQESRTYYVQVKEEVDITQKKREQLENVIKSVLQSKPEEINVQEVGQQEDGEDEAEVDDCIIEHITHISRASTTERFGNTTDPSSTEGFGDPTLTEEYIESSF